MTTFLYVFLPFIIIQILGVEANIGVNYGMQGDNLPPPRDVAKFLVDSTIINHVRLFDANPNTLEAFAHTGIAITVTIPNVLIPLFTDFTFAQEWVKNNISTHIHSTNIIRILVGNEVLATADKLLITSLVPAMETIYTALIGESLERKVQVSTPHSLGILSSSSPPSMGRFRQGYDVHVIWPLLNFLRGVGSPFMVNPYPFFVIDSNHTNLDYALFRPNSGVFDENTGVNYTNMLDAQLDAIFCAMRVNGYDDVDIAIAETGWPSQGDPSQVGVDRYSAATYNANVIRQVTSGVGTPLMPNRTFETYIFALLDENLKIGPTYERHFGLFGPDLTPNYDIGLFRPNITSNASPKSTIYFSLIITIVCWLIG
ncbi:glucan endo-1,3-beta-glucosidase [Amaranthus tricolor]|uniref:glucan endo-1,3-beta-glucosidase n=1 Tax=Amaranthus tricolor TaxID=29722 RepID=UPI0025866E3E|nr:glucan endo-1,3-beta-glucosidase [Amaranthus tricolor]